MCFVFKSLISSFSHSLLLPAPNVFSRIAECCSTVLHRKIVTNSNTSFQDRSVLWRTQERRTVKKIFYIIVAWVRNVHHHSDASLSEVSIWKPLMTKRNLNRKLINIKRKNRKKKKKKEEEEEEEEKMNRENKIKPFYDFHSIRRHWLAYTKKILCNLLETVLIGYAWTFIELPSSNHSVI